MNSRMNVWSHVDRVNDSRRILGLVDEQMVSARWKSKLTQLLNSLPSHQKHEYHQLIDEMDSNLSIYNMKVF